MPICSTCGGNISAHDATCPYCGETLTSGGAADWDLLTDDVSLLSPPPAAPSAAAPPPWEGFGNAPGAPQEDWLLSADELNAPSMAPQPLPVPPWTPTPAPPQPPVAPWASPARQEPALPPWTPVTPAPAPPSNTGFTEMNLVFDVEEPGAAPPIPPQGIAPTAAVPIQNVQPAWQAPVVAVPQPAPVIPAPIPQPLAPTPPAAARVCPSCGRTYGPGHRDDFCDCGAELVASRPPPAPAPAPVPATPAPKPAAGPQRPPAGTRCLVLYGADKRPVQYFPLGKDAMLIGRLDPASGCFPDIDVSEWVDAVTARKVSRKHALILHVRGSDSFTLRPLPGNTGTQVNAQLCPGPDDVPLAPGTRVILGGAVRLKFEVT